MAKGHQADVKYKAINQLLEKTEIMWAQTIGKLLEDESLRKNYSEKAKQKVGDFRIEKIVQEWKVILK
jgi:hypothetical protein